MGLVVESRGSPFLKPSVLVGLLAMTLACVALTVGLQQRARRQETPTRLRDRLRLDDYVLGVARSLDAPGLRLSRQQARRLLDALPDIRSELLGRPGGSRPAAALFAQVLTAAQRGAIEDADWRSEAWVMDPDRAMRAFRLALRRARAERSAP